MLDRILPLILLSGVLGTTVHAATDNAWQLDISEDGIKVYTREVEGSKYREFKGVVDLDAGLPSAVGVLDNAAACVEWLHLCEESRVLDKRGWSERFIYQVSDLPFPASTRDAIFLARIRQGADGHIHVTLDSRPDFIPQTRYVRIRESHGEYLLQPMPNGKTRLTWTMYIDPAGRLPAFMVNRLLTDIPLESLRNFRDTVKQDKYRVLEFRYDDNGNPVGLLHKSW